MIVTFCDTEITDIMYRDASTYNAIREDSYRKLANIVFNTHFQFNSEIKTIKSHTKIIPISLIEYLPRQDFAIQHLIIKWGLYVAETPIRTNMDWNVDMVADAFIPEPRLQSSKFAYSPDCIIIRLPKPKTYNFKNDIEKQNEFGIGFIVSPRDILRRPR